MPGLSILHDSFKKGETGIGQGDCSSDICSLTLQAWCEYIYCSSFIAAVFDAVPFSLLIL
jgi:hypothetical protein